MPTGTEMGCPAPASFTQPPADTPPAPGQARNGLPCACEFYTHPHSDTPPSNENDLHGACEFYTHPHTTVTPRCSRLPGQPLEGRNGFLRLPGFRCPLAKRLQ